MLYKSVFLSAIVAFLVLFLILFIYLFTRHKKRSNFVFWGSENLQPTYMIYIYKFLAGFFWALSLGAFFIALSRPQEQKPVAQTEQKGVDILFVLDISDSMLIEDMPPLENRLESAKHHIKQFVENRKYDRLGLVVFSGEAYTRVPLTTDYGLLIKNLESLTVSDTIKKGTAIGVALAAGVNRLKSSETTSKVAVLLTDGENNTGVIDPLTALDLAVAEGIKTYTLGIGKDGQSMLPVFRKDRFGRKIKSYRPFPTKINEELLRKIAYQTGGEFYRASNEEDMSFIFDDIDRLEKSVVKTPKVFKLFEHYQSYLQLSVLFLALGFLFELIFFWRGY